MILLTNGPTMEQMEAMKSLLEAKDSEMTVHARFLVSVDGETVRHPFGGVNRTPRLQTRVVKVAGTPRLTQQHLPITVQVLEDFSGGELMYHDHDIGKAGTELELQYSFVDHVGEVKGAKVPGQPVAV